MILEHHKSPRNYGTLENPSHSAKGFNPLCGDRLELQLRISEAGTIEEIKFQGDGCAISRSSASMMTQALKGKTVAQAEHQCEAFLQMLKNRQEPAEGEILGKLRTFSGIWQYPSRIKCASLAWHAFRAALEEHAQVSTE
jgi:nitrogen fixation NifU-like protein